jgi:hypothetical protein
MISIVIEPTTLGERGQRYRVTYLGSVLVESTRILNSKRAVRYWLTASPDAWRFGASAGLRLMPGWTSSEEPS